MAGDPGSGDPPEQVDAATREGDGKEALERERRIRLGRAIAALRVARGLQQQELAQKAGIAKSTLSGWEKGTGNPGGDKLGRVLEALGLPLGVLQDAQDFVHWVEAHDGVTGEWLEFLAWRRRGRTPTEEVAEPQPDFGSPPVAQQRAAAAIGDAVARNLLQLLQQIERAEPPPRGPGGEPR